MRQPQVGDIWCWDDRWHVLLVEQVEHGLWWGISLEDGEIAQWYFDKETKHGWEQVG